MARAKKSLAEPPKKEAKRSAAKPAGKPRVAPPAVKPVSKSAAPEAKKPAPAPSAPRPAKVAAPAEKKTAPEPKKSKAKAAAPTPETSNHAKSEKAPAKATAKSSRKSATTPAAPVKAEVKKTPAAPKSKERKEATPAKDDAKSAAKKAAQAIVKSAIAPKPKPKPAPVNVNGTAAPKVLANGDKPKATKKDILARILAMRADDTRKTAQQAATKAKPSAKNRVPASVIKAKEAAEKRKAGPATITLAPPVEEPKKAPASAAKRRKAPYTKTELRELRDILHAEKDRLLRDLQLMNDVALSSEENMSRSFSNHQADAATDSSALETTFMTRRYEEERLQMVIDSIKRLEEGTFGLCEMCDSDEPMKLCETCPYIPVSRLRAKPFAKFCVPCRELLEKKKR